jgi:hypothetical protein
LRPSLCPNKGVHRKPGEWREVIFYGRKFVRFDYQERAPGYRQLVNRNIANNEDFARDSAALSVKVRAGCQVLETIR